MISDLKSGLISKLLEVFPTGYVTYDEDLPENISKPAFLIQITNQSYNHRVGSRFISDISFDISYYTDKTAVRADCIQIQETLLKAFDIIDACQVINKTAKITDSILHFTFDIRYSEMLQEEKSYMQQQQTNTNI